MSAQALCRAQYCGLVPAVGGMHEDKHGFLTICCEQDGSGDSAAPFASLPTQPVLPNQAAEHVKHDQIDI